MVLLRIQEGSSIAFKNEFSNVNYISGFSFICWSLIKTGISLFKSINSGERLWCRSWVTEAFYLSVILVVVTRRFLQQLFIKDKKMLLLLNFCISISLAISLVICFFFAIFHVLVSEVFIMFVAFQTESTQWWLGGMLGTTRLLKNCDLKLYWIW